jgi:hypothetical protein
MGESLAVVQAAGITGNSASSASDSKNKSTMYAITLSFVWKDYNP